MTDTTNKDLQEIYDEGKLNWHSGFNESLEIVKAMKSWKGRTVLEIGCGEGHLASMLAYAGADVLACDYASEQIRRCLSHYGRGRFKVMSGDYHALEATKGTYDVVIMQGVLEHLDDPGKEFAWISNNLLSKMPGAAFIISVPHWLNPRGFILQSLRLLLDAKISLTDLHYFLPSDLKRFGIDNKLDIVDYALTDQSWGAGKECIEDLAERLPKACPNIPGDKINALTEWLRAALLDPAVNLDLMGATAIVKYVRR